MRTIALLTDFGTKDNYVGVMKGVILNINPKVNLVDITHEISPQNVWEAGFLLYKSFKFFPKNTIFLVVVDPGVGSKRKALAIKTKNYYFVGPDNGVLSLAVKEDGLRKAVSLENKKYFLREVSSTFWGRDVFSPVSAYLSKGISIDKLGRVCNKIKELKIPSPQIKGSILSGRVIYIDRFGNLITNINLKDFKDFTKNKEFIFKIKSKNITKFYPYYQKAKSDELFLCEGSFGYLEVSLKNKSASSFLKAKIKDKVKLLLKKYARS